MSQGQLPDVAWRHDPALLALLAALDGPEVTRVVGGAVRDTLVGLPVKDFDLATRLLPDAVIAKLKAAGIKSVPTGIAHGTITAVIDRRGFEVTTLRRDVATDGRRATVAYTDDWDEDAARRDFTINALYADPLSGALYDPTGGIADLAAGRVRFIGDAGQRIDEDHLRILRWFRFTARFAQGGADAGTIALIRQRAPQLRGLSRERVADELLRILALGDPVPALTLMVETGVLAEIIPEAGAGGPGRVGKLLANEALANIPPDAVRRLVALLPTDAVAADSVASRLKLSNRNRKRIVAARGGSSLPDGGSAGVRALGYYIGIMGAQDRLLLLADDPRASLAMLSSWQPPRLPIGGGDIIALGVTAGPDVARRLRAVEDQWVAAGFPDRTATLAIARALVARA